MIQTAALKEGLSIPPMKLLINLDQVDSSAKYLKKSDIVSQAMSCCCFGIRGGSMKGVIVWSKSGLFQHTDQHGKIYKFTDCICTSLNCNPGDSGSWVWCPDDNKILGMVSFSYQEDGKPFTIIIPIYTIVEYFLQQQ